MELDYKGLRDRHLNVFCGYDSEHLENNITKALINTFDSFDESEKRRFCNYLLDQSGKQLPDVEIRTYSFLQKKPDETEIKSVPSENRIMIGFSPTGKCWGFKSEDIQDEHALRSEIIKDWLKDHPHESEDELEKIAASVIADIKSRRINKGSIPDAWIIIKSGETPLFILAFENKKYNLDPDQINNHMEKSLFLTDTKDKQRFYFNYEQLAGKIKTIGTYLGDQFVEYLTILGYLKIYSLPLACSADKDIRKRLIFEPCQRIMLDIWNTGIDKRGTSAVRKHLNKNSFLREINLCFGRVDEADDNIYVSLAMGPTMRSAQMMYKEVDLPTVFTDRHIRKPWISLHFQYHRGRNISNSYWEDSIAWNVDDYISYWKKHYGELRVMTTREAVDFIKQNGHELHFSEEKVINLSSYFRARTNPVLIVPELVYEIRWPCAEIAKMKDNAEFESELKAALKEFLDSINYHIPEINPVTSADSSETAQKIDRDDPDNSQYAEPTDFKYYIIKVKQWRLDEMKKEHPDTYRYEATRYCWKIIPRNLEEYPYVFSVTDGIVEDVYRIERWEPVSGRSRYEFFGHPAPQEIRDRFIGKRIPDCYRKKGMASPVLFSKN